jgi:hypothetical protein
MTYLVWDLEPGKLGAHSLKHPRAQACLHLFPIPLRRYFWGAAGSFPPPVSVGVQVYTGGVQVFATNKYDNSDPTSLPNANNTDTNCIQRLTRTGTLTLDGNAAGAACFSSQVRLCVYVLLICA